MKNQLFTLIAFALLVFTACQPPAQVEEVEQPDYAAFDSKVETIRAFIKAHCDEDLNAQSSLLADTLAWSPPYYNGNEWLGKEDYVAALKGYHDGFENITFTEGINLGDRVENGMWSGSVFPEENATSGSNAIRVYGNWSAKHTESGKDIGVKWFGIMFMNADGKVARITEYWDVNGLAVQIAAE